MIKSNNREWFLDYWLPSSIAIIIHLASIFLEVEYGKDFFQRSGAVLVLAAVLLESQAVVRLNNTYSYGLKHLEKSDNIILQHLLIVVKKLSGISKKEEISRYNKIRDLLAKESQLMIEKSNKSFTEMVKISKLSLILAIYGTAIWAYGDFFVCFLRGTCNVI